MIFVVLAAMGYISIGCFVLAYVLEQRTDWLEDEDITLPNMAAVVLLAPALIGWSLLKGERV